MTAIDRERDRQAAGLYERYGKPLEAEHRGEYVAISSTGRTILGKTVLEVAQQASVAFGPEHVIFRVGEGAVGTWR